MYQYTLPNDETPRFGEVLYFFQLREQNDTIHTLTMVEPLSNPDTELLSISQGQLVSCKRSVTEPRQVVNAKGIEAVVAAIPHDVRRIGSSTGPLVRHGDAELQDGDEYFVDHRFAIVEKPGMMMSRFGHDSDEESSD